MPVEPRGLTGNMFLSIQKENRLNKSSTTEELAAESPTSRLGKGVKVPEKVSRLRQKLGLKAKQEPKRPFRPPKGRAIHEHLMGLGLVTL
jgi:hypothetical protein